MEFWFGKRNTKCISFRWMRKYWIESNNKPRLSFHENGGRKFKGDKCFDCKLIIGYFIVGYTIFDMN